MFYSFHLALSPHFLAFILIVVLFDTENYSLNQVAFLFCYFHPIYFLVCVKFYYFEKLHCILYYYYYYYYYYLESHNFCFYLYCSVCVSIVIFKHFNKAVFTIIIMQN